MASPYSTRSRKGIHALQNQRDALEDAELSPKTSTRLPRPPSNIQSGKVCPAEKADYSTPQPIRSKRETQTTNASNAELLNLEQSCSSNNDSLRPHLKNKKKQVESDRAEPNVSSLGLEQNSMFVGVDADKQAAKKPDDVFINEKKSYRTQFHRRTVGVPYRKCHSGMEEKVIGIINKINCGKECHKEIETLLERTRKISIKEMMNRYFVSGLHVIHRLVSRDPSGLSFEKGLAANIDECLQELHRKIEAELDCPHAYEALVPAPRAQQIPRKKLAVWSLKYLRKVRPEQKLEEAQQKAIETTDWFISNNHSKVQLLVEALAQC